MIELIVNTLKTQQQESAIDWQKQSSFFLQLPTEVAGTEAVKVWCSVMLRFESNHLRI